ncbi:TetR/AcrR family transcriptional regulator [Rathayibacter sp. Leaf296]|uniref:TetR/AcrR family transcriptional regulator n=1 Tax=Rathayibacter sp. Leaf296 TaxID=1736327 RepID=UPI000702C2CC|nr:TetR/AcrR family transcriptional regulator [Rathayibacter sp. Leaf296]KQQ08735.1 TetR family transcriptional regulator [Rathayibacter sp. Leaf296]
MSSRRPPSGRRERAKEEKRRRITSAARELFAEHGVGGVTTQQIADRADVAVGTLFLYASSKAELLIMVQNQKFAAAIDEGLAAADGLDTAGALDKVLALVRPVVICIREQPENGRAYLHELVFGDPAEPHRGEGLTLSLRLEDGLTRLLAHDRARDDAATIARVITSVIHVTTAATAHLNDSTPVILGRVHRQISVVVPPDGRCRPQR